MLRPLITIWTFAIIVGIIFIQPEIEKRQQEQKTVQTEKDGIAESVSEVPEEVGRRIVFIIYGAVLFGILFVMWTSINRNNGRPR